MNLLKQISNLLNVLGFVYIGIVILIKVVAKETENLSKILQYLLVFLLIISFNHITFKYFPSTLKHFNIHVCEL